MKQQILIAIAFGSLFSAPSFGASTSNDEFTVAGVSDVVSTPLEAESAMKENAQAQCGFGAVAIQKSATEFALYPRAYPTTRVATATFVCMRKVAGAQSLVSATAEQPDTRFRGQFVATGISEASIPTEAELNMLERANMKCWVIAGPQQVSKTVFRAMNGVLYASARFDCVESALDKRKCAYPDDSNPDCFKGH